MGATKNMPTNSVADIQNRIKELINKEVTISYQNRGKEKSDKGVITAAYGKIFMFEYERNGKKFKETFSYTDIMTGDIKVE